MLMAHLWQQGKMIADTRFILVDTVAETESKILTLCNTIYICLICRLFLQSLANPDLLYIVHFIHTNLTTTVTLVFLFISKVSYVLVCSFLFSNSLIETSLPKLFL